MMTGVDDGGHWQRLSTVYGLGARASGLCRPLLDPSGLLGAGPDGPDGTATAIRGRWRPADGAQSVWLHSRSSGLSETGSACKLSPAAEGGSRPEVSKHWGMV